MTGKSIFDPPWQFNIPATPFTPEEIHSVLGVLRATLDAPCRPSEEAPRKALINLGGIAKSGKDVITAVIEREFRSGGLKVYCPPESAEHAVVRRKLVDEPFIQQARHLAEIEEQVFDWAYSRDVHVIITHRGLIDILYWYEREARKGLYSRECQKSAERFIHAILDRDLVDAFFHLTCSPEEALRRRHAASLTDASASGALRMAGEDFREASDIYETVFARIRENVSIPLPLFRIDTTRLTITEAAQEVLRHLLPTLCWHHKVPVAGFLTKSHTLLEKEALQRPYFEEQLKLRGSPPEATLGQFGWTAIDAREQEDVYLDFSTATLRIGGALEQLVRIRREWNSAAGAERQPRITFYYKSIPRDRIFSYRTPLTYDVTEQEASDLLQAYPILRTVKKFRKRYRKLLGMAEDSFLTLHLDAVEGLGAFTEIRAVGLPGATHERELLEAASQLGFSVRDIVTGSYLAAAIENQT